MSNALKTPWKTLASTEIYHNDWISVIHNEVLNPSGQPGIYGVVHYHNTAIGICAVEENNDLWLVGQYRFPLDAYSWEIPEGGCPASEDPLSAARRELMEETGLTAKAWTPMLESHLSNSVSNEKAIVYLAQDLTAGLPMPEETEDLTLKRVSLEHATRMVFDGEITDSISMLAIMKLNHQLGKSQGR